MFMSFSLHPTVRRSVVLAAFTGAGLAVAGAQTLAPATPGMVPSLSATAPLGSLNFPTYSSSLEAFSSSAETAGEAYDPSQAAQTQLASLGKVFSFPDEHMQYGQRRRYGSPRYRGGNTNADGSEKYTGYLGAGLASPIGTNSNYLSTSWGAQVGAGRNLNKHFGVNLEFAYDHFGMTGGTINNQSFRYFSDATNANGLDANSHIWSISVQPTYQIYSGQGLGAYITGGVGFYHKVANFTLPQEETYYDPFYGYGTIVVQGLFDHYTSNAPGFDGGVGVTYKFSRFSNERFYAEARYVYMDNTFKAGDTDTYTTQAVPTYTGNNFFPENSRTTSYFPVKVGIRF